MYLIFTNIWIEIGLAEDTEDIFFSSFSFSNEVDV